MSPAWRAARSRSRRDEAGVVAVIVAVFASAVFFALGAISVDVARWYLEAQRVQKAADAASRFALSSAEFLTALVLL